MTKKALRIWIDERIANFQKHPGFGTIVNNAHTKACIEALQKIKRKLSLSKLRFTQWINQEIFFFCETSNDSYTVGYLEIFGQVRSLYLEEKCAACNGSGFVGPDSKYGVGFHGPNTCSKCCGRGTK